MSLFDRRPWTRWLVPLLVAFLVTAGVSGVTALTASAGDKLAPRTASQLLVDVQQARLEGLSGTIVQNADLGLPSLPGIGGSGSSDLTSMVSGSHTLRLWYAGPNRVRLSLLGSLGESDVVRNGTDLWTWASKDKTATHRTLPLSADSAPSIGSASPVSPQQAADEALKAITPSTKVSTDRYLHGGRALGVRAAAGAARRRLAGGLGTDRHRREDARADPRPGLRQEREQPRLRGGVHLLRPDCTGGLGLPRSTLRPARR